MTQISPRNECLAEAMGTFALVFAGCAAIVVNDLYPDTLGHMGISTVFGLVVMAMIYALGNISGAHLNPAVSLGFYLARRLDRQRLLRFVLSQLGGALAAGALVWLLFPEHSTLGNTMPAIGLGRAFAVEVVLSFLLMFVILNVSTGHMEKGIMAGVAVGGTVALGAAVGGPLTGASMNPARTLAPALFSMQLEYLWLYVLAPCIGTSLAYPFCRHVQGDACCAESETGCEPVQQQQR